MNIKYYITILFVALVLFSKKSIVQIQKDSTIKVFQFPANKILCIDDNADDWAIVPNYYIIGSDQLTKDFGRILKLDTIDLNEKVRVAWLKGLNSLYALYHKYDNYWDFSRTDLCHDIFEFWITPFDYAGSEGFSLAVESKLCEN